MNALGNPADTIAAVATPLGAGGVGIIRVSGAAAAPILCSLTGTSIAKLRDRYFEYGQVRAAPGGEILDEVLFVIMRGPRSFTGEDVAEIHGHGGAANMGRILRAVIDAGARHAEPGEFTRRAFDNRRIDLTRAEAIVDIVNASSEKALRVAQEQLRGSLGKVVQDCIAGVTELLAEIEASIDFPEDDLPLSERQRQFKTCDDAAQHCGRLAASFGIGRVLRDGVDVVLRGPVNVGKSSLFNRLVGHDRALVAVEAGTTRDYVEAQVVWEGLAVTLVDTAGLRATESDVEDRGIALGSERAARADLELLIHEQGSGDPPRATSERQILVVSKVDLVAGDADRKEGISTSAKSGLGLEDLKTEILRRATGGASEGAEGAVVTNERQRHRLRSAAGFLHAASSLIETSGPAELVVVELNAARAALWEITGEQAEDEMLDELFSRFCIGK